MPRNSDTFWSRVLFKDFIRHFRKMSPEQIAEDITESMDALDDLNPDGDSFGSLMVRWANERMNGAFATAARENGKKGGRPRKNQDTTADAPASDDGVYPEGTLDAPKAESGTSATNSATTPNESTDEPTVVTARQSQGRTGAPSTGATSSTAPVRSYRPRKVPHPKGEYEVFDFAGENGIPEWVANEFYQRFFVERDGTDTDGNNIDNWKGALINYNKSRKREPA